MRLDYADIPSFIEGKRVALVSVNKDMISLLKFYTKKFVTLKYQITAIIDLSLSFRDNVRRLVTPYLEDSNIKLITTTRDLVVSLDRGEFDFILEFDNGFSSNPVLLPLDQLEKRIREHYDNYLQVAPMSASEWNFRTHSDIIYSLNTYISNRYYKINIMSAYVNYPLVGVDQDIFSRVYAQKKTQNHDPDLYDLVFQDLTYSVIELVYDSLESNIFTDWRDLMKEKKMSMSALRSLKPVFVIGSDYAVGKASYCINQYTSAEPNIILEDVWATFVNPQIHRGGKPSLSNANKLLHRIIDLGSTNPDREIFIKYEGHISDWSFGIPYDRFSEYQNFHECFRQSRWVCIIKESEDLDDFKYNLDIFCRKMNITSNRITIYKNTASGFIEVTNLY